MTRETKAIYFLAVALVLFLISAFAMYESSVGKNSSGKQSNEKNVKSAFSTNISPVVSVSPKNDISSFSASISSKEAADISSGVIITSKGDNLLVLINKNIRLPETYEPADLEVLDGILSTTAEGLMLRKDTLSALKKMAGDAKKAGINLIVLSAYRSFWNQANTFNLWVARAGLEEAETFSARPGHSQHQLGTTVDFTSESVNSGLSEGFATSPEGTWLFANAVKYGFVLSYPDGKEDITGYMYEPWHWRYIGVENAAAMAESGLILEEYLKRFGVI